MAMQQIAKSSLLVADYLLASKQASLTPIHVIKLTYISHGWTLALRDKPLIADRVEAWKYGPVIPVLYHAYREYGADPIQNLNYCHTGIHSTEAAERLAFLANTLPDSDIIDKVLLIYGNMSGSDLIAITHTQDTPWAQYYREGEVGIQIPNEAIQRHYKELLVKRQST